MKELCPRKDALLSRVPTQIRTSDYQKFRQVSGLLGSLKKPAWVSGIIPTSRVPANVGSFDCQEFRPKSGLLTDLAKKLFSDLPFWIPIQTIPNSGET
jgi:hypothetical protein